MTINFKASVLTSIRLHEVTLRTQNHNRNYLNNIFNDIKWKKNYIIYSGWYLVFQKIHGLYYPPGFYPGIF